MQSKTIAGYLNNYLFYNTDKTPYLETVVQVSGASLKYVPLADGKYGAKVHVKLSYYHDSVLVKVYDYILVSPAASDTSIYNDLLDLKRLNILTGATRIELELSDENIKPTRLSQFLSQHFYVSDGIQEKTSDIELIDHYRTEITHNVFCKNNVEIYPKSFFSYGKSDSILAYYMEFYNLEKTDKGKITFVYSICNALDNTPVLGLTGYSRQMAAEQMILLAQLNIKDLKNGKFILNVDAYDIDGKVLAHKSVLFRKFNGGPKEGIAAGGKQDVFEHLPHDTIIFYLNAIYYTIAEGYKQTIYNTLHSDDSLAQRFCLRNYWNSYASTNPEGEFQLFRENVHKEESLFAIPKKNGFQTDRGRIYLKYGAPDFVEKHRHDLDYYPYDQWTYYYFKNGQTNVPFVFYTLEYGTENFKLVHTTARGEQDFVNWQDLLKKGNTSDSQFGNSTNYSK